MNKSTFVRLLKSNKIGSIDIRLPYTGEQIHAEKVKYIGKTKIVYFNGENDKAVVKPFYINNIGSIHRLGTDNPDKYTFAINFKATPYNNQKQKELCAEKRITA